MPPLEAAIAGNKVIGYTGEGGKEYWRKPIFEEIHSGDLKRFSEKILDSVNNLPVNWHKKTLPHRKKLINKYEPQVFRDYKNRISRFIDAGWSFSSFGGYERVKEKIESYAHSEHNNDKFKNPEHIANCQRTGADLFHRKVKSKKIERNFFPKSLLILMDQNPEFYFGKK